MSSVHKGKPRTSYHSAGGKSTTGSNAPHRLPGSFQDVNRACTRWLMMHDPRYRAVAEAEQARREKNLTA